MCARLNGTRSHQMPFPPTQPTTGSPRPHVQTAEKGVPASAATGGGARLPLGDHAPPCHALCVAGLPLQTGPRRTRRQGPAYTTPVTFLRVATLATCTPSGETAATKVGCPDTASALAGSWGDLWVELAFDQPGGRGEKGHLTRARSQPASTRARADPAGVDHHELNQCPHTCLDV